MLVMRNPSTSLHNLGFLLALLLLAALGWEGLRTQRSLMAADTSLRESLELITRLQGTLSALQDVETGMRGYVITAEPAYLAPYSDGLEALARLRPEIGRAMSSRPGGADWLQSTNAAIDQRVALAARGVDEVRRNGTAGGAAFIRGGSGRLAMERVRELVGALEAQERRRLEVQRARVQTRAARGEWLALGGGLGALTLLLLAMLAVNRSLRQRAQALREQDTQRRFLRTIVDTDENLIAVRDKDGRFTLCNRAYCELLGLTPLQVEGRHPSELAGNARLECLLRGDDAVLAGGEPWRAENVNVTLSPGEVRSFQVIKRPVDRADGSRHVLMVGIDITARLRAEQLKNEFVSTVSHELRTPLTSIRGALSMVSSGMAGELPPDARPLLDIAGKNTERLVRLINDILDIEKLETGRLQLEAQALPLMPLLEQALEQNGPYAREYGVRLRRVGEVDATVEVDPDRFAQIMSNLLSNAIKHSPRDGLVDLEVARVAGGVELAVRDRGGGIPLEFQPRVFERFAQADASDARQRGGTGLGLAITRSLVAQMGGEIGFVSIPGEGTRFHVRLPEIDAPASASSSDAIAAAPRVVLLQRDAAASAELGGLLQRHGYTVDIARDVASAWTLMDAGPLRGVAIDLALDGDAGPMFLRRMREHPRFRHLPALLIGLDGAEPAGLRGGGVGVVDWLSKPLDPARVAQAVRSCLQRGGRSVPSVLHVEDDPDVRELLANLLRDEPLRLHHAGSLAHARAELAARQHDLVILDLMLPDGDGAELLPELGAAQPPVPVIIFSATDLALPESRVVLRRLVKSRSDAHQLAALISDNLRRWPAGPAHDKEVS